QSIHFQTITRAEKKKENFKKIQKAIEERWENLKESPKKMINSVLDKPRKSIIMDRLIVKSENNKVSIDELKEVIHFLPNKKAAGQSGLQYEWFKYLPNEGIEVLRDIINMTFKLNDILEEFKW
ncbi:2113_t:CDS:2, partial [Diversispora eburnea]